MTIIRTIWENSNLWPSTLMVILLGVVLPIWFALYTKEVRLSIFITLFLWTPTIIPASYILVSI